MIIARVRSRARWGRGARGRGTRGPGARGPVARRPRRTARVAGAASRRARPADPPATGVSGSPRSVPSADSSQGCRAQRSVGPGQPGLAEGEHRGADERVGVGAHLPVRRPSVDLNGGVQAGHDGGGGLVLVRAGVGPRARLELPPGQLGGQVRGPADQPVLAGGRGLGELRRTQGCLLEPAAELRLPAAVEGCPQPPGEWWVVGAGRCHGGRSWGLRTGVGPDDEGRARPVCRVAPRAGHRHPAGRA